MHKVSTLQSGGCERTCAAQAGDISADLCRHSRWREHSRPRRIAARNTRLYHAWLQDPSTTIWIAQTEIGNAPVGYLVLAKSTLPIADLPVDDLAVKRIYLLHRFHGSGVGKRRIAVAISHAQLLHAPRLLLGVYANNHEAIAFYVRQGFRKIGERIFNVGGKNYDDAMLAMDI